ncbi:MAG: hypothetical protein LC792_14675 [Actinobacteria bacterium]|nr:hypothetical protein [Actinomycetota bacterium]
MSMTIQVPDDVARRLAAEAARRGHDVGHLATELLAATLPVGSPEVLERPAKRRLEFVGMGASTSGRTAAEAEEMLAEGFGRD